jgi:hypothetical protein
VGSAAMRHAAVPNSDMNWNRANSCIGRGVTLQRNLSVRNGAGSEEGGGIRMPAVRRGRPGLGDGASRREERGLWKGVGERAKAKQGWSTKGREMWGRM